MVARGYDKDFATRCFSQIKGFGEYGFPESHAASFALLVYVSSWIKCHHPEVFACALLNSQPMGFYAPAQIVRDAEQHEVDVLDADINFSEWIRTLEENPGGKRLALRLGLRLVDGLTEGDVHEVPDDKMKKRKAKLPTLIAPSSEVQKQRNGERFRSVPDAAKRGSVTTLEKLAAADAFRSLGLDRRQALWEVKALTNAAPLPLFSLERDAGYGR